MCDMVEFSSAVVKTEKRLREFIASEFIVPRARDKKWTRPGCDPDGCLCHIDVLETLQLAKLKFGFALNRFGVYVTDRQLETHEKVLEYDLFGVMLGKANQYSIHVHPNAFVDQVAFIKDTPVQIYRPNGHLLKVKICTPFDEIQKDFLILTDSDLTYDLDESPGRIWFAMKTKSGRPWNGF